MYREVVSLGGGDCEVVSKTELNCIWVRHNNKGIGGSCIMVYCSLKGIPNTIIDGVNSSVNDNCREALAIF